MAQALGCGDDRVADRGNAGAPPAAYAAQAGLHCVVAMPADTPSAIVLETRACGADVRLINGPHLRCGAFISRQAPRHGWYEVSTLKEPYRIEGKKTMGYELWEEFENELPDVIVYRTGGGVGLIGMCKAFDELETMGLAGSKRPRMIAAQADGCAPIVKAFEQHAAASVKWENAFNGRGGTARAESARRFHHPGGHLCDRGDAIAVSDDALMSAWPRHGAPRGHLRRAPKAARGTSRRFQTLIAQGKIGRDVSGCAVQAQASGYK
jgi:threonine synthase